MVNAEDFTYSKAYLGLLFTLGAALGIIFLCAPSAVLIYRRLQEAFSKRTRLIDRIDEENAAALSETSDETSLPMTENSATQANSKSARWSMDGRVAGAEPPLYGGLQKYHTF